MQQVHVPGGIHENLMPVLLEKANFESGIDEISMFSLFVFSTQIKYQGYVAGITPSDETIFGSDGIDSRTIDALNKQLKSTDTSVESFAKVKYYLDKLFYDITEKGVLIYTYQKPYLISSSRLGSTLNISRATIHRYKELGLESVGNNSHKSYPKHNIFYWSDGIWASRIQALYQGFKLRNQSKEELIAEIEKELDKYKKEYGGTFEEVFKDVIDPYELEEPDDYFDWRDLLEDFKKLNE